MILAASLLDGLRAAVPHQVKVYYWAAQGIYTNPWFWAFTASIPVLEKLRPADRKQRLFSWGLMQDFVVQPRCRVQGRAAPGVRRRAQDAVRRADRRLPPGRDGRLAARGQGDRGHPGLRFPAVVPHWVRHKGPFWHFHAIHHSQRELNVFTDLRVHSAEYLISEVVVFLPMFALGLPAYAVMGVGSIGWWYTRFIHANIRTNLGPLKHVLVTPQYYRVHHSIEPRHQNLNFGVVLSVWDRMFGTLHRDYDEYPATGVEGLPAEPPHRFAPWAVGTGLPGAVCPPVPGLGAKAGAGCHVDPGERGRGRTSAGISQWPSARSGAG